MRRILFALPLSIALVASCTYDFEAPFAQTGSPSTASSSGSGGVPEGGASEGGVTPTEDGGCAFTEDWETPVKNTFPVSWFRLGEMEPADFAGAGQSKVTRAVRRASTTRIAEGAVRSPDGAQHMGAIAFGDVWPQLAGGVSGVVSVALWFRVAEVKSDPVTLISKVHDAPARKGITIQVAPTGALALHREGPDLPLNYEMGRISSVDGWNRWHHLVMQRTDTPKPLLQFYVDGVRRDWPDDVSSSFVPTNDPFVIGGFDGDVDEVIAWDRLITQSEVWALMDAAASGGCGAGNKTVCYGPAAKGTCDGAKPVWSETCPDGHRCVVKNGSASCVQDPCGK